MAFIGIEDDFQKYEKMQEFINASIKQERKDSPDKVTDKEIELICKRDNWKHEIDDLFQCITRQASVEQLADVMEKYLPIFDRGENVWAMYYANAADAKEDDRIADKIIKAVELWGKRDFYRYKKVIDFYTQIIKPEKLNNIVSTSFKPEYRNSWFDRPEQAAEILKSAKHLLTECAKKDNFYEDNFYDYMRVTDGLFDGVYYSNLSILKSTNLAKATEELLQTTNQIKRRHLEIDIEKSMGEFRENFPNYKSMKEGKIPKDSIVR